MSIMFEPDPIPLYRPTTRVATFRYFGGDGFEALPYVRVTAIHRREGPNWSTAEFDYVNQNAIEDDPTIYFQDVIPLMGGSDAPTVVATDDRIVVAALTPEGDFRFLFDGFCTSPGTQFSDKSYQVGFKAVGVEARCWDRPLVTRWERDASTPKDPAENIATDRDLRFNPHGKPNCIPDGTEMMRDDVPIPVKFPVFLDENLTKKDPDNDDKLYQTWWTVSKFVQYVLATANGEEEYVQNPDFKVLDAILDVYTPKKGQKYIDLKKAGTYDENPIVISDYDAGGRVWPQVLDEVLNPNGFSFSFRLARDDVGQPYTYLDIYKLMDKDPSKYKDLFLDAWGNPVDPALSNVHVSHVQHDTSEIANEIVLHTNRELVQASFILCPLFEILATDVDNKADFLLNSPNFNLEKNSIAYRRYGVDETGGGHWNLKNWIWSEQLFDFSPIFPNEVDAKGNTTEKLTYVPRLRPARNELVSLAPDGTPRNPSLHISFDYTGNTPAVWDGESGTWYELPKSFGWNLLKKRLGIEVNISDPNAWGVKNRYESLPPGKAWQLAGHVIRSVEWLHEKVAATESTSGNFYLMLTCVIEADKMIDITAARREVSPTRFTVRRVVDARSEFIPKRIYKNSMFSAANEAGFSADYYPDFDKEKALKYAENKREMAHLGKFSMQVEIPRLTNAYNIGDRIRQIDGRDCRFAMNLGGGLETATYPKVIGLTWTLGHGEKTTLILADNRIVRRRR